MAAPPPPVIRNAIRKALPESKNGQIDESDDSKKLELPEKVSKITKDRVEREIASATKSAKKKAESKDVPDAAVDALLREKQNLEMRVQELVNSAENKTAEIATLRMEVNRLRVCSKAF